MYIYYCFYLGSVSTLSMALYISSAEAPFSTTTAAPLSCSHLALSPLSHQTGITTIGTLFGTRCLNSSWELQFWLILHHCQSYNMNSWVRAQHFMFLSSVAALALNCSELNIWNKGRYLKDVHTIFRFLDLPPLVHIQMIIPIVNPRSLSYFVRFSTTPSPLSVRTSFKYRPWGILMVL